MRLGKSSSMTGIELLMNNKKPASPDKKVEDSIDLGDLQSLENELNELSTDDLNKRWMNLLNLILMSPHRTLFGRTICYKNR